MVDAPLTTRVLGAVSTDSSPGNAATGPVRYSYSALPVGHCTLAYRLGQVEGCFAGRTWVRRAVTT